MPPQPGNGFIEHHFALAEGKTRVMTGCIGLVEGRDRDGGHPGLLCDVPAEGNIIAIEAERREIGGDKIASPGLEHAEAKASEPLGQPVALG